MTKSLIFGRFFFIFTSEWQKCFFLTFLTYVNLFEPGNSGPFLAHEILALNMQNLELRAETAKLHLFSMLSMYFHLYLFILTFQGQLKVIFMNNLHHQRSTSLKKDTLYTKI